MKTKKLSAIMLLVLMLGACHSDGGPVSKPFSDRPYKPFGNPANPVYSFDNGGNGEITGMLSVTTDSVDRYIKYRLNEYDTYNPEQDKDITNADIAAAAVWLVTAPRTVDEITAHFEDNMALFHMAGYVIDNRMNPCFGADVGAAAGCFVRWRENNQEYMARIADEILKRTEILSIDGAEMHAADGSKLKFIVDEKTGKITGISVADGDEVMDISDTVSHGQFWTVVPGEKIVSLDYTSVGKELGLSYSDFGVYSMHFDTPIERETVKARVPFAGGYASKQIAQDDIKKSVAFAGRAIGRASDAQDLLILDGNASLVFDRDRGASALSAQFDNWYDIVVTDNGDIYFSNYTNDNNSVRMSDDDNIQKTGAQMNVGYYAQHPETGIPTEVAGLVQYTDDASGVKMDVAFGGK